MSTGPLGYSLTSSTTPYEPADPNPLNVVFLPVMSDNESKYITAVSDNSDNEIYVKNMIPHSEVSVGEQQQEKKPVSLFDIGANPIAEFYIGSVTVVGLYILFRLLHKGK
jgi:hypothetical protein